MTITSDADLLGRRAAELSARLQPGPCLVVSPPGADAGDALRVPAHLIDRHVLHRAAAAAYRDGWPADGDLLVHMIDMDRGADDDETIQRLVGAWAAVRWAWPAAALHVAVVDRAAGTWSSLDDPTLHPLPDPERAAARDPLAGHLDDPLAEQDPARPGWAQHGGPSR